MQRRFEVIHWTPERASRVARNQISTQEVEEVLADPACHMRIGRDGRLLLGVRRRVGEC